MLSLYLGAFGFGALFILTSIIFGGSESDFDKDIDLDMDGDIDVDVDMDVDGDIDVDGDFDKDIDLSADHGGLDMEAWLPFLSLRFWTFAFFSFGMSGSILTFLGNGFGETITFIISLILGLTLGYGISWTFQKLKKDSVTASTETKSFEQHEGTVQLTIRPNSQGKIRLRVDNQIVDIRAITQDLQEIPIGSKVIVVSVEDGVANVTRLSRSSTTSSQPARNTESNNQLQ